MDGSLDGFDRWGILAQPMNVAAPVWRDTPPLA
jgi:hypothetical protein